MNILKQFYSSFCKIILHSTQWLKYFIINKTYTLLIMSILYITFLQCTTLVYCNYLFDIINGMINKLYEQNSIVSSITVNDDDTSTIRTKDGDKFFIACKKDINT